MPAEPALDVGGRSRADEAIVSALRAGDERVFRDMYERNYPAMKRVARGYVHSEAVAEEIVQETWLAILTRGRRRSLPEGRRGLAGPLGNAAAAVADT